MTPALPPVGERIREARLRDGISLRGLARAVGVSASLISQIETGKSRPSVSTLYAITKALGISVEDVFDGPEPDAVPAPPRVGPDRVVATAVQAAGHRVGPVVRPAGRDVLQLDSGVTWERLGHLPGTRVDFLLVTYAPGGSSSSGDLLMRHSGAEYGYLIEGELTVTLGFEEYRLGPGDAVSFPSTTPHRYRNDGVVPAVGIWYVHEDDEPTVK
ncbi:helix-turn-helix domain-containing protein [Phytohabitans rumicis]|uniref:Aldehyde dehydrogenase n=1 Tax=Phytohabitans rumicis TaxID=1076125 RepID=A0A6V8LC89_9ACTN|nr:cupin domain-containing protein [Phytohabitans rumicis]GFJ91676.1 aldehyde dehydrogenase [Phytohabitans rumicis]